MATKKRKTAKKATAKKATAKRVTKKVTAKKTAAKRKPAARKVVAKRKPAKKAVAKRKVTAKKAPAVKALGAVKGKPMTKTQVVSAISERVDLTKKQVSAVMDVLDDVIAAHVKKGAVGQFKLNGLFNVKAVKKPARKARKGINPFTGEEIMIKAKAAYRSVKVTALKRLKELAA